MNISYLNTDNIQPLSVGDNINLFTRSTGNIIAGAATTTTLFNINAKNIQLTGLTSLTGNTTVNGNVVVSGNISFGTNNIITTDNIQPVAAADTVNLYTNSTGSINLGGNSSTIGSTGSIRQYCGSNYIYMANNGTIAYSTASWYINNTGAATFNTVSLQTLYTENQQGFGTTDNVNLYTNTTGLINLGGSSSTIVSTGSIRQYCGSNFIYLANNGTIAYNTGSWNINPSGAATFTSVIASGEIQSTNSTGLIIRFRNSNSEYIQYSSGAGSFYFVINNSIKTTIDNSGTITATAFYPPSDYRIKSNVNSNNETIDNLRPVTYFNKLLNKKSHGFIAHEVQEHFPELVNGEKDAVNEKGEPKYQSIDYMGLISILVKEIQELKQTVKQQNQKIEILLEMANNNL